MSESRNWEEVYRTQTAEIERLREERRWIPVTERLPEEGVYVLVWHKGGSSADIGWREHQPYYTVPETIWTLGDERDKGFPPKSITHWMPLPKPPVSGEAGR
jgi:hypothetical protein